jgi:hypothetical protein
MTRQGCGTLSASVEVGSGRRQSSFLVELSREANCAHPYLVAACPGGRAVGFVRRPDTSGAVLNRSENQLSAACCICRHRAAAAHCPCSSAAGSEPSHPANAYTVAFVANSYRGYERADSTVDRYTFIHTRCHRCAGTASSHRYAWRRPGNAGGAISSYDQPGARGKWPTALSA